MDQKTKETVTLVGAVSALAYMLVPQVRDFVDEKTESLFGGDSSATTDTTTTEGTDPIA